MFSGPQLKRQGPRGPVEDAYRAAVLLLCWGSFDETWFASRGLPHIMLSRFVLGAIRTETLR